MDFALVALPRSGTSWAAAWLMDGGALCYHDPLTHMAPDALLTHNPGRRWGISCTGAWVVPGFLEALRCPIVVIDNNLEQVQRSLEKLGAPTLPGFLVERFDALPYPRFNVGELFDEEGATEIWRLLRSDAPMDVERWRLLKELNIQPDFAHWKPDPQIMRDVLKRIAEGV